MMQGVSECNVILRACVAVLSVGQCIAFVQAPTGSWTARSCSLQYPNAPGGRRHSSSSSSGLRMGKKAGGRGGRPPKRKKKSTSEQVKQSGSPSSSSGGETSVADAGCSSEPVKAVTDQEGAGTPIRYEGAGERLGMDMDMVDSFGRAAPGVRLKDGVVGADQEREAKIEETLRRLGVKGASADETQDKKKQVKKQRGGSQGSAMEENGDILSSVIEEDGTEITDDMQRHECIDVRAINSRSLSRPHDGFKNPHEAALLPHGDDLDESSGVSSTSKALCQGLRLKCTEGPAAVAKTNVLIEFMRSEKGIPAETQLVLERVLIAGFVLCLSVFVFSGSIIGFEAYQMSTTGTLPQDLDDIFVQKLQPLFTPALLATFACSISLGILKVGQMGQEGVVYREDD